MSEARQLVTGFVETNGTRLYYEMMGEGHPLVLLHGGYMDRRMWDDQFAVFAERYQVIRYDIRGFGRSELPQVPYADREDLYALLTYLEIQKAYLVGLSLGGMAAIDFTLEHLEMVAGLVLVGSSITGFPIMELYSEEALQREIQRREPFMKAVQERNLPALIDALIDDPTLVPSPDYASARQRVRENLSEYSFVFVLDPAPRRDIVPSAYERLVEIQVPTLLIVGGDDDFVLHRMADKLEQDIKGARRVTIAGTHHMPNMEKPQEFNEIVLDFLKSLQ